MCECLQCFLPLPLHPSEHPHPPAILAYFFFKPLMEFISCTKTGQLGNILSLKYSYSFKLFLEI